VTVDTSRLSTILFSFFVIFGWKDMDAHRMENITPVSLEGIAVPCNLPWLVLEGWHDEKKKSR
jgi:hypothetical protein